MTFKDLMVLDVKVVCTNHSIISELGMYNKKLEVMSYDLMNAKSNYTMYTSAEL